MIIECTQCHTRYNVPDSAIGANGRMVRCKQCAHSWQAFGLVPAMAIATPEITAIEPSLALKREPLLESPPESTHTPTPAPEPVKPVSILWYIAFGSMVLLASILSILIYTPGMLGFPPSQSLVIADLAIKRLPMEKYERYAIEGNLLNQGNQAMRSPAIQVMLVDEKGTTLQKWKFAAADTLIEPGKPLPFSLDTLDKRFSKGNRYVVDAGNGLELALRHGL